ncbi:MAG: hypothetical protein M3N32_11970 [Actinomycetota bacterium]|nr:hypothetical protein [Actinomycetota bacterium]
MALISNQTTVACTPEDLFDHSVDIRNEAHLREAVEGRAGVVPDRSDR